MAEKRQFLVAGLGRFGRSIALALEELGCDVIAIDANEQTVQSLSENLTYVVCGNAADEKVLHDLGAASVDVAIIGMGDIQGSVLCTLILKEMGVKTIVAVANDDLHGKTLEKIGANKIIYPQRDTARRLAAHLYSDKILDYIDVSDETALIRLKVPDELIGKSLIEANLRAKYNVYVTSIKRGPENIVNPKADEVFQTGDYMIVYGTKHSIAVIGKDYA
ncbi:MAG: TrkA family potassium uptake protein [Anaerovibrio sp.]|uniref:potassium channel family protein n=1 Tax=uncultured Anaerovibrio sp. TaxID=361586 RepID=UPI0025D208E8|nr:TrkA family potassium uptake protein [uncultured Anaerovibrio sp.]MBQ3854020.1 TrkA family potassium uptake protein [Anaerovibrio sp.]